MTRALLTATLLAALVAPAQGDVWKQASNQDPSADFYNALMEKGDDATQAATSQSMSLTSLSKQIEIALEAYRAAAKVRPKSPEPHFRIASLIHAFFIDCAYHPLAHSRPAPKTCDPSANINNRDALTREMLVAWDTFEALAPLDPRVNEMLQSRAIERTKMVARSTNTKSLLEGAMRDYSALLDRNDGVLRLENDGRLRLILGNLAETYMMLGDIDRATDTYIAAAKAGADGTTLLGLAVALDRDERGPEALRVIRELGPLNFDKFKERFEDGDVFFVPAGEEHYYFALGHEAFGSVNESIEHWRKFIRSGAHPQFQPRAKEHLDKLTLRRNLKIEVPLAPDFGREPVITPRRPVRQPEPGRRPPATP